MKNMKFKRKIATKNEMKKYIANFNAKPTKENMPLSTPFNYTTPNYSQCGEHVLITEQVSPKKRKLWKKGRFFDGKRPHPIFAKEPPVWSCMCMCHSSPSSVLLFGRVRTTPAPKIRCCSVGKQCVCWNIKEKPTPTKLFTEEKKNETDLCARKMDIFNILATFLSEEEVEKIKNKK